MKRLTAILLPVLLFCAAFVAGKSRPGVPAGEAYPDSLRSVWFYTEGIKQSAIYGDSLRARDLFREAIRRDSTYAPAYFELATGNLYDTPEEGVELAGTAFRLDTTNKWYQQFYGQTLIYAGQYGEALKIYRDLNVKDPKDPDNYRLVAALYEILNNPYMAISTLDSAETRFGRIPYLSAMKRRMYVTTGQTDKAIDEARLMVEEAPYEASHHVVLASLYGEARKDSLARTEYAEAMRIDSTDVELLASLADFHSARHDYRALLDVLNRLFVSDEVPLDTKVRRFQQLTSDTRFYREFFIQLDNLASTLAVRYPSDKRVVDLYAKHLLATGQLDRALDFYKLHLGDNPPQSDYYSMVIDIENYRLRPDSVDKYLTHALELFPDNLSFRLSKGNQAHLAALKKNNPAGYDTAADYYRKALKYAATDSLRSVVWGMIGDTYHAQAEAFEAAVRGDSIRQPMPSARTKVRKAQEQSYKAYDKSLVYWKDNTLVLNNYAYFLSVEERDLERALDMSGRVVALTDKNPTYLDTYAWVLFKLGRAAEAKKIMQQAIALDTQDNGELLVHYGDILIALGERFMAETYWRRALEKGFDAREIERRMELTPKPKE